jgi:NADH:ubiquinone oxidoreductase subunit E
MIQLGRPKAKTHKAMPMDKLMRLSGDVEDLGEDGFVTAEAIDDLSADQGVPREKLYAGLGMSGGVQLKLESKIQIAVCTGGCQEYGALECVSELLDIREDLLEEDAEAFDLVPKNCLNRCESAAVIELRTPDGTAVLASATPQLVRKTVEELLAD